MNHHIFVIDSCIFAKLFLKEEDRDTAISFLENSVKRHYKIYVPRIFIYEILSICSEKNLERSEVFKAINQYQNCGLNIVDPSETLFNHALEIAKHGHTKSGYPSFYDSIYHALAIENNCTFITSDIKHYVKTKKFGFIKLLKEYEK